MNRIISSAKTHSIKNLTARPISKKYGKENNNKSYFSTSSSFPKSILEQFSNPSFTQLTNRSLLIVAGPETQKFMQGVTSNNISQLFHPTNDLNDKKVALYSIFLNPKGKVLTDGIIIRPIVYEKGVKKSALN